MKKLDQELDGGRVRGVMGDGGWKASWMAVREDVKTVRQRFDVTPSVAKNGEITYLCNLAQTASGGQQATA